MDNPNVPASTPLSDRHQAKKEQRHNSQDQQAASELAEKIAALPALHPYAGAAKRNVYLFTPTEAERDLVVQALRAFARGDPASGSS